MTIPTWQDRLVGRVFALAYPDEPTKTPRGQRISGDLRTAVDAALAAATAAERATLRRIPKQGIESANLRRLLLTLLAAPVLGADGTDPPPAGTTAPPEIMIRAVRIAVQHPETDDHSQLERWLEQQERPDMPINFVPDKRGIDSRFDENSFDGAVTRFIDRYGFHDQTNTLAPFIGGKLLLASQVDPTATGFIETAKSAYDEAFDTTIGLDGKKLNRNLDTIAAVAKILVSIKGDPPVITYQELAAVSQFVIDNAQQTPLDDPNFSRSVSNGLDAYVSSGRTFDSLELPPVIGDEGSGDDANPDNLRACAMIYPALQLDRLLLFDVVDRIAQQFSQGLVPIGLDGGGRLLDQYMWNVTQRLDPAARHEQYARVFAAPGGDVSPDVTPNTNFDDLWMRFLSSVAEFDRQRQVATVVGQEASRSQAVSGEYVRKAGRDLAANLSSYGWAYTHFAARRLGAQIRTCIDIISRPEIQKAYGVNSPWQVVERVANLELGAQPNITQYRTMAKAGKDIIDLLADKVNAFTNTGSSTALFPIEGADEEISDFTVEQYYNLLGAVNSWLATKGMQTDDVDKYSQPVETVARPSLPVVGARPTAPADGGIDQIRKMVSAGQTPSLEQLQKLLPTGS